MKCYTCGATGKHRINCPAKKPKKPNPNQRRWNPPPIKSIVTRFIPLEILAGVPALEVRKIHTIVQLYSKIKHIWISKSIAESYSVSDFTVGEERYTQLGWLPADMFSTGIWPLTPQTKAKQFGIDLSSWRTMEPGQIFSIQVRNNAVCHLPWAGALEVLTVR